MISKEVALQRAMEETGSTSELQVLPEVLNMSYNQFQKYYSLYTLWKATGKRHLLQDLMNEPDEAWLVVFEIEKITGILKEMQNG